MPSTKARVSPGGRQAGRIRRERCAAILAAAEQEFAQHGFRGTSTQAIADGCGLAKAQVHYYYETKEVLYRALLEQILNDWNCPLDGVSAEDDPATVLSQYIHAKLRLSWERPERSRVFAAEVMRGAPALREYLHREQRAWVDRFSAAIEGWIAQGRMRPLDPLQLIFMLWSVTQHYADYEAQVLLFMQSEQLSEADLEQITVQVTSLFLQGCGIEPAAGKN
ncbi:MAG TPA: TetR/AcrR family transcriptional regulator [Motiliproteus sp.]